MFSQNTDKEWEKFGKEDPYFGVVSHDIFHGKNHSNEVTNLFFDSGFKYIDKVIDNVRNHFDMNFKPRRALDFGCGVGRLVIPLSRIAEDVTGLDVSESMLSEARKNCEARGIHNARFIRSDDDLSLLDGKYDLIHSYIVFQHIPTKRGLKILSSLLSRLEDGGICVVHFTYAKTKAVMKVLSSIKRHVPLAGGIINLAKGRRFSAPQMQMNEYDLNRIFAAIHQLGTPTCFVELTDHGGELGACMYFRNKRASANPT